MSSFSISDECEAIVRARIKTQPLNESEPIEFTTSDAKAFMAASILFGALAALGGLMIWMLIGDEIAARLVEQLFTEVSQ